MAAPILKVGIVCPAPIEYQICRDLLGLSNEIIAAGRPTSLKTDRGIRAMAVQAGPGKIQSASATQLLIDRCTPDVLIDVGAAGSLSTDVAIFDIVCAKYVYEYDICAIEEFSRLAEDLTTSTILPDLSKKGEEVLQQFAEWVKGKQSVGFAIGNIASGEKDVKERTLREELHTALRAIACNWETSAILKVAQLNGVKAISLRVITDNAGEEMSEELKTNWEKALRILYPVLEEFLYGGWLDRILKCDQRTNGPYPNTTN